MNQERLRTEVESLYRQLNEQHALLWHHGQERAITRPRSWLKWPPRLRLDWDAFGGAFARGRWPWQWSWVSRHGSVRWYGTVQYLRFGPLILQLGERPDWERDGNDLRGTYLNMRRMLDRQVPSHTQSLLSRCDPKPLRPSAEQVQEALASLANRELHAFAPVIRTVNAFNGWGEDFTLDRLGVFLELVHTEITEAFLELQPHQTEPPEFYLELGDVVIRCLDVCELLAPGTVPALPETPYVPRSSCRFGLLLELHAEIDFAMEVYRKAPADALVPGVVTHLTGAVALVRHIFNVTQLNLRDVVAYLVNNNAARGLQHGGRRA